MRLAAELGTLPNRILIEGHTDSKPFASKSGYSNWELSADRANSSRRLMQEHGLRADQVSSVRGFADQQLRNPKDAQDPSNRRISLIVQYMNGSEKGMAPEKGGEKASEKPKPTGAEAKKE
jgi:chemotaxis protein MotB